MMAALRARGMMAVLLLAWGLVVLLAIVQMIRRASPEPGSTAVRGPPEDAALATLRDRYARGAIDRGEYEERRRTLLADGQAWP